MMPFVRWLILVVAVVSLTPGGSGQVAASGVYLKGHLLVAAPGMRDPRFRQSVILMIDHNADGAYGLIINKPVGEGNFGNVMRSNGMNPGQTGEREEKVYWGGPVSTQKLYVLHSPDFASAETVPVTKQVSMTLNLDVLAAIGSGHGPKQTRFLVGYAGWGPGQLEKEFGRDDWLSVPGGDYLVFDSDPDTVWQRASEIAGLSL